LSVSSRSRSRTISPRYSFLTTDVPFQCFHNMAGIYVYIGPKFVPRPLPYANIFFSRSFLPFYCLPFCISFTVLALINLYIKSFLLFRLAFCHLSCSLLNIFVPKWHLIFQYVWVSTLCSKEQSYVDICRLFFCRRSRSGSWRRSRGRSRSPSLEDRRIVHCVTRSRSRQRRPKTRSRSRDRRRSVSRR
jgi:hypothetical protein